MNTKTCMAGAFCLLALFTTTTRGTAGWFSLQASSGHVYDEADPVPEFDDAMVVVPGGNNQTHWVLSVPITVQAATTYSGTARGHTLGDATACGRMASFDKSAFFVNGATCTVVTGNNYANTTSVLVPADGSLFFDTVLSSGTNGSSWLHSLRVSY